LKRADAALSEELEEVFRAHARLVYRTAYCVTGSPQDAEDVVQAIFLQLLRRGFPPDFRRNPKAYLYRAAVNRALNAVKSRRQRASDVDPATLQL
jgi:RNA polymerase sigma factor (sigma-70 family)